MFHSRAI